MVEFEFHFPADCEICRCKDQMTYTSASPQVGPQRPHASVELSHALSRISSLEAEIAEARSVVQVIDDILSRQEREWLHNKEAVLFLRQYKQKWGI